ncbi:MAG: D-alanyl-D-alanine carboxypeptidase [Prevotella sp.]|nr:D-alanyl-D-alanine carboxypeptidase [Bacteroides sp.]MCM1366567.1 D-alanyl-D-alanine carboxypeptidase [Prevotella sp.]MCM1437236.1 D-alanyl-D-alanine carboxypeptidase [Prevotella sp.]
MHSGLRHIWSVLMIMILMSLSAVAEPIDDFKNNPAVNSSSTSVIVIDLKTGKTIVSHNAETPLLPASIMKSLTIASLMQLTSSTDRYLTEVYLEGPVKNGVLQGNLLIIGSGDPTVNSRYEPKSADIVREIVQALKKRGVKEISGEVAVEQGVYTGPSQPESWANGDKGTYYGTGVHGFNFEDNRVGKSSVSSPASVFLNRLQLALKEAGIMIGNREELPGGRKLLLRHESAPIFEIMRSCMMRSDNMFAESMLRTYGLRRGKEGSTSAGAAEELSFWRKKGIPMEGVKIVDGSGLSRQNRLTAAFLGNVLKDMASDVDYVSYFPLAGQEGTLRGFLKGSDLDAYIAMKTGSMNSVQCYAGYKLDDDFAPTHVVVVMGNNFKGSRSAYKQAVADLLLGIFD